MPPEGRHIRSDQAGANKRPNSPAPAYQTGSAFESEAIGSNAAKQKYTVQTTRKSTTFFYDGLDANGFDKVINPIVLEPVIQCTLFLSVYEEGWFWGSDATGSQSR